MTHRRTAGAAFLLALTLTSSAYALRKVQWSLRSSRDVAASGITTGATVTEVRLLRPAYEGADAHYGGYPLGAFRGITIGEVGDKPCYIQFNGGKLDETGDMDGNIYYEKCSANSGDHKTVSLPDDAFIRGVQVCTNDSDNSPRLKGLKLFGVRFDDEGKPSNLSTAVSFERANCKKWHEAKACATGEVVTKFKIYKKDGAITALGLECSPAYSPQTAPKDYSISFDPVDLPAPDSNGISQFKAKVHIKNTTAKGIKYQGVQVRLNAEKFPNSSCVLKDKGNFELPPNGVMDHEVFAGCRWDDQLKTQASCLPGRACSVPLTAEVDWQNEPYSQFYRPGSTEITGSIKRPGGDPSAKKTAPAPISR